ncbi:MAG: glycosyltransferase family 4 protein [Verrucomicrobiota bacterium]
MVKNPLTVAWISDFPVEWLPDLPEPLRLLPRQHPATWQMVLLSEFEKNPALRVHVILMRRRIARSFSFERNGTVFHILKAPASLRLLSLFWLDTYLIKRVCQRIKPDLVHAWGSERGAVLVAHRLGYPYVATVQGLLSWYKEISPPHPYERFAELLERRSFPRAPVITTESAFAVEYLKQRYHCRQVRQAEHAPNWAFHQVQRRPVVSPIRFISVGTLGYRKGTDLLLKALDQLHSEIPFKLTVICGPNPDYVNSLRPTVSAELWQRVEFKNHLLPAEIAKELETPTLMLLPTRADVSPNAVKEALVAGMPVVASRVGGIPDYLIHGRNGFMFPVGDLKGFVRAIKDACAHPLFGKGLVEPAALAQTRAYLSPERMAGNFLDAYEAALTAAKNASG